MLSEGQEILDGRYKVIKRLNGGAFGDIYRGISASFKNCSGEEEDQRDPGCEGGKCGCGEQLLGKSEQTSEAGDALLGEQAHPQTPRQE